ncbi:hypothetical protein ABZP36_004550 [Zizania latifolia]
MEHLFMRVTISRIIGDRLKEDFVFIMATGNMDAKVTKFHPEDFLVTLANPAIRDATVEGHIAVQDGENSRPPRHLPVAPECKDFQDRHDHDDDADGRGDHPRKLRAKSIWSRIGYRDEAVVTKPSDQGRGASKEAGNHHRREAITHPVLAPQDSTAKFPTKVLIPSASICDDTIICHNDVCQPPTWLPSDPMRDEAMMPSVSSHSVGSCQVVANPPQATEDLQLDISAL